MQVLFITKTNTIFVFRVQGGQKVGLQLFNYLFHVLDLIHPNHNSKPVFHIPYSHFGNVIKLFPPNVQAEIKTIQTTTGTWSFGGRSRSPIAILRNGAWPNRYGAARPSGQMRLASNCQVMWTGITACTGLMKILILPSCLNWTSLVSQCGVHCPAKVLSDQFSLKELWMGELPRNASWRGSATAQNQS